MSYKRDFEEWQPMIERITDLLRMRTQQAESLRRSISRPAHWHGGPRQSIRDRGARRGETLEAEAATSAQ
jgi:hypothetical protein